MGRGALEGPLNVLGRELRGQAEWSPWSQGVQALWGGGTGLAGLGEDEAGSKCGRARQGPGGSWALEGLRGPGRRRRADNVRAWGGLDVDGETPESDQNQGLKRPPPPGLGPPSPGRATAQGPQLHMEPTYSGSPRQTVVSFHAEHTPILQWHRFLSLSTLGTRLVRKWELLSTQPFLRRGRSGSLGSVRRDGEDLLFLKLQVFEIKEWKTS